MILIFKKSKGKHKHDKKRNESYEIGPKVFSRYGKKYLKWKMHWIELKQIRQCR